MIKLKNLLPECNECGRDWNHGHDHEAGMAKNELRDTISNASKIDQIIGEGDNLPGWVSAYISLAADYMHSVAEYLAGESSKVQEPGPGYSATINEEVSLKKVQEVEQVLANLVRNISTSSNIPSRDKIGILGALKDLQDFVDEVGYDAEMEGSTNETRSVGLEQVQDSRTKAKNAWDKLTPQEKAQYLSVLYDREFSPNSKKFEELSSATQKTLIQHVEAGFFSENAKPSTKSGKESGEKFIKCRNCKKLFTQTIHKGKKSLPVCPTCGTHN